MIWFFVLLSVTDGGFEEAENKWRIEREASMTSETSWLNLAGLFWLEDGENRFGTAPDGNIVLPPHATVPHAGSFFLDQGKVSFKMARGQRGIMGEKTANQGTLGFDDVLAHNHLRFLLIERADRLAIRVRNLRAPEMASHKALDFYEVSEKHAIQAVFVPYEEPKQISVNTVINSEQDYFVPGVIQFTMDGRNFELLPTIHSLDADQFFIMFKDETSGNTTYPAGRFLYAPIPVDGKLTLNFNRAINPPCAYTAYATCPLPPGENWLPVPIEAGERNYGSDLH